MKRCYHCKSERLVEKTLPETLEAVGVIFTAQLPALVCEVCGESSYAGEDLRRFELAVARKLADLGEPNGEAFRLMRKSIGVKAVELAQLLNVAPETLSRWENGKLAMDEGAFLILGDLVEDHCTGNLRTLQRLKALREPRAPKPSHISIELASGTPT
jgi:putative zinc finger/helix-turn-helix YgiT family protein